MLKKLFIAVLGLSSFSVYGDNKFGYINSMDLINDMPEKAAAEKTLDNLSKKHEDAINAMQEEFKKKYEAYVTSKDSLPESIKTMKETELQDIQQRLENYQQVATQEVQKKYMELQTPIADKIRNAIKVVGDENGFTFIFDVSNQGLLYYANDAIDVMPLVRSKLGLPKTASKSSSNTQSKTSTK